MECRKCDSPGTILLRKQDYYCTNCFLANTNHKFRASLGKNKVLSKNEKVLVCLSGGLGSTVLLNLIENGMAMDINKKLRISPYCLHLIESENDGVIEAERIMQQCSKYNFDVYFVHIAQYVERGLELSKPNCVPQLSTATIDQYQSLIHNLPTSARKDFILKIKRNMFIKSAEHLQCKFIFNAETTTTLAINLLCNITLGRGSQVENDVSFCDDRSNVKILKPMKDITQEELIIYSQIYNLKPVETGQQNSKETSLQSVIASFVGDLQKNFPATISTLCKTADKIGVCDKPNNAIKCVICESALDIENSKLTALDATKFSRTISQRKLRSNEGPVNKSFDMNELEEENINKSLFPLINEKLCYSCSRNHSLINNYNMSNNHMETLINP